MSQQHARVRVATYNVHSWIGRDRRADPARVLAVIRELDADLVALQEVPALGAPESGHALARCRSELGYTLVEGPTLGEAGAGYGNALLSRLPIERVERIELGTPTGREPRGAVAVEVALGSGRVLAIATHLGLAARERVGQSAELLDWIDAEARRARCDVRVLLGDLNEWRPRAAALRRIEAVFGRTDAPRTFPAAWPLLRLDRIFALPHAALLQTPAAHRSATARVASDHLPVVAEIAGAPR